MIEYNEKIASTVLIPCLKPNWASVKISLSSIWLGQNLQPFTKMMTSPYKWNILERYNSNTESCTTDDFATSLIFWKHGSARACVLKKPSRSLYPSWHLTHFTIPEFYKNMLNATFTRLFSFSFHKFCCIFRLFMCNTIFTGFVLIFSQISQTQTSLFFDQMYMSDLMYVFKEFTIVSNSDSFHFYLLRHKHYTFRFPQTMNNKTTLALSRTNTFNQSK